jgi:heme-degrading monooxygenase HmoA
MINVGFYYRVVSGHEKEFEEAFFRTDSFLKSVKGFRKAVLYKRVDSQNEYMIYTEWEDLDSFRRFIASKEYSETTKYGRTILEGRPTHRVLNEINDG